MINKKVNLDVIRQCNEQDPAYYILDEEVITNLSNCVIESQEEVKEGNPKKSKKDKLSKG